MATFEVAWGYVGGHSWTASATRFGPLGGAGNQFSQDTENRAQVIMRSSYTLANMYLRVTANTTAADSTFRSRVAGANGNLVVTVAGGATGAFQDTVNSDSLVDGNLVNFSVVTPAGAIDTSIVGFTMVNASGDDTVLVSNSFLGAGLVQTSNLTRYRAIGGSIAATGTESAQQYTVRSTATLSNFRVFVVSNSIAETVTMRTRKNLGNGDQSVSISASGTGSFEDTTNTDSVVAGDEINYQIITPVTAGTIATHLFQVKSAGTGRPTVFNFTGAFFADVDRFTLAEGGGTDLTSGPGTEAASQIAARSTFTASNLFVNVTIHGASGGVGFFLRLGGVNSALTLNVADSTTGLFEDTTNTVDLVSGDLYNTFVDHGGGAGSIEFPIIGFQNGPTATLVPLIAGGYLPNVFDSLAEEPPVDFGPQGEPLYYWAFLLERPGAGEPIPTQPTTPTIGGRLRQPTRR